VRAIIKAAKQVLRAAAPPETWRRALLQSIRRMVGGSRPAAHLETRFTPPKKAADSYNLRAINRILRATGRPPLAETRDRPRAGEAATARWVL